jgi:membrane protease YdiL (CAAX protease family)
MGARAVVAGLTRSAFIADVDAGDRAPLPIIGTFAIGLPVGLVGGAAAMMLVSAVYLILTGRGDLGPPGISRLLLYIKDITTPSALDVFLELLMTAGASAVFFLAFVAVAAACSGKTLIRYVTAAARIRWRLLFVGLLLGVVAIAPLAIVDRLTSADIGPVPIVSIGQGWGDRLFYLVAALLLIPAAAAEELTFRGWLLRLASAFTRNAWLLVFGVGVLFAAAHLDFSLDGLLARTMMGAGLAYMTLRLGGIEFATGVHSANNIVIVLFVEPLTLNAVPSPSGMTLDAFVSDVATLALYVAVTEAAVRVPALRRLSGLDMHDVSPPLPEVQAVADGD